MLGDMMKEGTRTRTADQIAETAARMGGAVNISVGADQTSITADVLSESGAELVALLADIAQNPLLPASELQRLQTDTLRSLAIARTQPGSLALERFRQILYPDHPYGRVFSTEEIVKSYTVEDLRKFHTDNFGARRTHVYVAGRFDAKAMRDAITKAFGAMPQGTSAQPNPPRPAAFDKRRVALINRAGAPQSTLYLGLPTLDPTNKDYIPFVVANSLLGGSFASRITSNIREQKGYTYSPNSQLSTRYRDGYWLQVADVTTDVTGASLKEIFYEVERLAKEPPTAEELQGIKNYLAGIFVLQNSSRGGVIGQLSFVRLHGLDESYLNTYVQRVLATTPADVQRITSTYLRPDRMAIVVVGDEAKIKEQVTAYGEVMP
jgi:predicted Zn-dependent peptidase